MIDSRTARYILEKTRELAGTLPRGLPGSWRKVVIDRENSRYCREMANELLERADTLVDCVIYRDACYYTRDSVRVETTAGRTLYFPADMLMLLLFHENAVDILESKVNRWNNGYFDTLDYMVLEVERMLAVIDPVLKRRERQWKMGRAEFSVPQILRL